MSVFVPVYDAYQKALKSKFARVDYVPRGPPASGVIECGSYSKPNHGCSDENQDSAVAYMQSLLWAVNGSKVYGENAARILDAYAHGLHKYNNSNAPLQAAWSAMYYTKAAEILAHADVSWPRPNQDQAALAHMLKTVTLPLIYKGSSCNGNWELSMLDAMAGMAVFTEDSALFDHALAFWRQRVPAYFYLHSADGRYPVHVPRGAQNWNSSGNGAGSWYGQDVFNSGVDGVSQETCRDLGHTQFGLASALNLAETAFIQGVDLYGEFEARLTAGMEFHSRLLLNESACPAAVCGGAGVHGGSMPTFEVGFNAYHTRKNPPVSLPYTERHLVQQVRPEPDPGSALIAMYETLSHGPPAGGVHR
jgi:hypothetical protein